MDELFTFVREGIARHKGEWRRVSQESGVSYSWVSKVGAGKVVPKNPGIQTLQSVADAIRRMDEHRPQPRQ